MALYTIPKVTTAERIGYTPIKAEHIYDTDLNKVFYGDGVTVGGIDLTGPPGPLSNIVEDLTPQLGGFLDPNGNFIGLNKGADLVSASPLVIGTDGDYFDVTGTTNFAVMTVTINRFFVLRFDDVLTVTNGGSIEIPGGVNFTTAAGDHLLCFSISANTVRIVNITKADGTSIIPLENAVIGPASAVDENIAIFDDTTGKLIKDGGINKSAITANTAKITNATHTGEVTGSTDLTLNKTAISNQSDVSMVATDLVLFGDSSDSDNLKKGAVQDILDLVPASSGGLINIEYFTSSGTWNKPGGTIKVEVTVIGGGEEGGPTGVAGGNSSFGSHCTGTGGGAGSPSGGDANIIGSPGAINSASALQAQGGSSVLGAIGHGGLGSNSNNAGDGGGTALKFITSGLGSSETVTVGDGGTGGGAGGPGTKGIVIVKSYN